MKKVDLVSRLEYANPGWPEWKELLALVRSRRFRFVVDECLGHYLASGDRLCFSKSDIPEPELAWLPSYVPALVGMKASDYELAGGFADVFDGTPSDDQALFSGGGNDEQLGFPPMRMPPGVYPFQSNSAGALFHINRDLCVLYPDTETQGLSILDPLETFTRVNIRQVLAGKPWFSAYHDRDLDVID